MNVCAARWGAATLNGNWTLLDAVRPSGVHTSHLAMTSFRHGRSSAATLDVVDCRKVGNGIASILFGSYLGSLSYDLHAGSDQKCHGPKCFALPHLIMAGASCLALQCRILKGPRPGFVGTVISVLLILSQPYHRRIRQSLSAVNLGNTESFPLNQIGSD